MSPPCRCIRTHRLARRTLAALLFLGLLAPPASPLGQEGSPGTLAPLRVLLDEQKLADVAPQALALLAGIEVTTGRDSLQTAGAIDLIVSHWKGKGIEAAEIRELADRAVALKEKHLGVDDLQVAASLKNMAMLYEWDSELDLALAPFIRTLAIQEKALGTEHPDIAQTLSDYATLLWAIDDSPESRELCERAIAIVRASLGPDDVAQADCLRIVAGHLYRATDYAGSRDLAQRRVEVLETHHGKEDPAVASALMSLSNRTVMMGEFEETENLLRKALAINEKAGAGTEAIHFNIGALYVDLGDYALAKEEYEIAIRLMEEKYPPGHRTLAFARVNLGDVLILLGDHNAARRLLESALEVYETVYGPDDWHVADVLRHLGRAENESGNAEKAHAHFSRALEIIESIPERRKVAANTLGDMGRLYLEQGRLEDAARSYAGALAVAREYYDPGNLYLVAYATDLADVQILLGNTAAARPLFEEALEIEKRTVGMDHPDAMRTLLSVAGMSLQEGDRKAALEQILLVVDRLDNFVRHTLAYLPERQALSMIEARDHPETLLFDALLKSSEDSQEWLAAAWTWTLNRRGVVLEELAARNRTALGGESAEARQAWSHLAEARRRLATLWTSGPGSLGVEQYTALLSAAREEKEAAELALAKVSRSFREDRDNTLLEPGRVADLLPAGSALVEIVRTEIGHPAAIDRPLHDIALILRPDGSTNFADLGSGGRIDGLVADWRERLESSMRRVADGEDDLTLLDKAGIALREAVWDPVARLVGDVEIVYFVPEGALHHVDLGALPTGDGRFLIETGPAVRLASTSRSLLQTDEQRDRASGTGILALGAPDFEAERAVRIAAIEEVPGDDPFRGASPQCALRETSWAALPSSEVEVRRLKSLWRDREPVVLLIGGDASEERFKREAAGKRVLHLATHGYFLSDRCAGVAEEPLRNPLLLSGLVMAGANREEPPADDSDDGILTAEELAALDLRGVELAVLSACDTGRGEVAVGEGVFGLRRALEIAGVRSVVMSLWPVPDRAAASWMGRFYDERLKGTAVQESVRRASLAALERLRASERPLHPYLWSGFVATGEAD